jgi:hypothetical protein
MPNLQPKTTPQQLIAYSMARKIEEVIDNVERVGYFGVLSTTITTFDPEALVIALGEVNQRRAHRRVRLALALRRPYPGIEEVAVNSGFKIGETFATDLLSAGRWRNTADLEDVPVAIATGEQATLHTLGAFTSITSSDVAREMLVWAAKGNGIAVNGQQVQLFEALSEDAFAELHSPFAIALYLTSLFTFTNAQRGQEIPELFPVIGLLRDPDVFADRNVRDRLKRNHELCRKIRYFPKTEQRNLQKKINLFAEDDAARLQVTLQLIDSWQRNGYEPTLFKRLTYESVAELVQLKLPKKIREPISLPEGVDGIVPELVDTPSSPVLERTFAAALLNTDEETRQEIARAVDEALSTDRSKGETISIPIRTEDFDFVTDFRPDDKLLEFVHTFCSEEHWGGVVDTRQKSLRAIIDQYSQEGKGTPVNPYAPVTVVNDQMSLVDLIGRLAQQVDNSTALTEAFTIYEQRRHELIPHIDGLVLQPLVTVGSTFERRKQFRDYLEAADTLMKLLKDHFTTLSAVSRKAVQICIAYILALDTVLVRVQIGDTIAHKAILMPLHPLHLWKYVRLVEIYEHGLDQMRDEDRDALLEEADNERHFLHTLFVSNVLTEDRPIVLPFAGALSSLPCYENTSNHYSGNDGVTSLFHTLDRFLAFYPLFARPLRVSVVDIPSLSEFLTQVSRFLLKHPVERLQSLEVRLFFTETSSARNYLASLLSGENERVYQELIALKRLSIQIEAQAIDFTELIARHQANPAHAIALFDQSELDVRDFQRIDVFLGESPFCITRQYQYDAVMDEFQVIPVNDARLFSHYNDLVNHMRHNLTSHSLGVVGRTQAFRDQLDLLLIERCAQWLFLADRVLPAENRLTSARIYAKHDGRREILVLAGSSDHFAREIEFQLKHHYNLYPEQAQIRELLVEFSHLIGDGLLAVIQSKDGTLMENKTLGLIGLLITVRHYLAQYPDAIVVSVDSQNSRRWLRITETIEKRGDLLALRQDGESYVIDAIEVKTFTSEDDILKRRNGIVQGKAIDQVATLYQALEQTFQEPNSPLTPPRREVLRDLFYNECRNRRYSSEFRQRWAKRLHSVFDPETGTRPEVGARIYRIDLAHTREIASEVLRGVPQNQIAPLDILYLTLTQRDVQRLIINDTAGLEVLIREPVSATNDELEEISEIEDTVTSTILETVRSSPVIPPHSVRANIHPANIADISVEWRSQIAVQFKKACRSYGIEIEHMDSAQAVVGPAIVRFPFELARGTRKEKLDRSLQDIGREMALSNLIVHAERNSRNLLLDVPRQQRLTLDFEQYGRSALPRIQTLDELPLALGMTPSGLNYVVDLKTLVHMLVGGTTGAGKTIFLYSVIMSLLHTHPLANDLQLVLSTSKLEDFAFFRGLPHLFGSDIITEAGDAINIIGDIANHELDNRSRTLSQTRVRSVEDFNTRTERDAQIRPIVIIVDEFADLADQVARNRNAKDALYTNVRRIAQAGRSRSVHLVLCTQRPTSDLFPSNIKALMNARVAFRMNSHIDSRTILDENGAENLLGRGDMLIKTNGEMERLQGYYIQME